MRHSNLTVVGLQSGQRYQEPLLSLLEPVVHHAASWLQHLAATSRTEAVPLGMIPQEEQARAQATYHEGALVVVLEGALGLGGALQIGIAVNAHHGKPLWRVMTALAGTVELPKRSPTAPWCAWIDEAGGRIELPHHVKVFIRACAAGWALERQRAGQR